MRCRRLPEETASRGGGSMGQENESEGGQKGEGLQFGIAPNGRGWAWGITSKLQSRGPPKRPRRSTGVAVSRRKMDCQSMNEQSLRKEARRAKGRCKTAKALKGVASILLRDGEQVERSR